jgi:hypothetical protein
MVVTARVRFMVDSSRVGYDGGQHSRDEEQRVGRKKPGRKRSQLPQKSIWTAVKNNAALVTAVLALFGVLITGAINTYIANKDQAAQREVEAFNAQKQRELEAEKAQNAALQTYLDQMGQMLLNQDLLSSEEGSELRTLARARTLSVFGPLNPEGRRIALVFLNEAALIDNPDPVISLFSADLSEADLSEADLSGANLSGAQRWTDDQLKAAGSLEGATMPDGQMLKSLLEPDGPTFEDWLKSKGRGEDGENSGPS